LSPIYEILVIIKKKHPTSQDKWKHELLLPETFEWKKVYTVVHKITWNFQYKLLKRILATNTFLSKIGIKDDNALLTYMNT
jgi:hypothetical protein